MLLFLNFGIHGHRIRPLDGILSVYETPEQLYELQKNLNPQSGE